MKMHQKILLMLHESLEDLLANQGNFTAEQLEAEIINLGSYLYLKDNPAEVDFELGYLNQDVLNQIPGGSWAVVDQLIDIAQNILKAVYSPASAAHAKQGIRMNIQLADNYGSFLKSYFLNNHTMGSSKAYKTFVSPLNSLWREGVKQSESPTQREVNYILDEDAGTFEVLINPYNPLVRGKIIGYGPGRIVCQSDDKTRRFDFEVDGDREMQQVVMHRLDKGDVVKYHR